MVATKYLHPALDLPQGKTFRALAAQPEVLNRVPGCGEPKEPAPIHFHEDLGATRVGTLRDHGSQVMHYVLTSILGVG